MKRENQEEGADSKEMLKDMKPEGGENARKYQILLSAYGKAHALPPSIQMCTHTHTLHLRLLDLTTKQ